MKGRSALFRKNVGPQMTLTWYVTFEVPKTRKLAGRRSPRSTRTFETEADAKTFARTKFIDGLIVNAGTINPHMPRQAIAWSSMSCWLEETRELEAVAPES